MAARLAPVLGNNQLAAVGDIILAVVPGVIGTGLQLEVAHPRGSGWRNGLRITG